MEPRHRPGSAALLCGACLAMMPVSADASADVTLGPEGLLRQIRTASLDLSRPLDAAGVRLDTGAATLDLESGVLIPVRAGDARAVEMVFVGHGKVRLEPPDAVEAGQLELFTGSPRLAESFTEAVFVVARDEAADALLQRPEATAGAEVLHRAGERYAAWKDSPERQTLGVETGILLDALRDPLYQHYFAGWFMGRQLGPFLLQIDPAAEEQVNLGQFVRFDVTPEARHSLARFLHRQQQRGQLLGLEVEDLGRWDSWVKAAVRTADGEARPGSPGFEPRHYQVDVTVDPRSGHLASRSRVTMRAVTGQRRVVRFELHAELEITRLAVAPEGSSVAPEGSSATVAPENGVELFYLREGNAVQVLLPQVPEAGAEVILDVACEGSFLEPGNAVAQDERSGKSWALRDALGWYPRTGANERATYDVTLRWPRRHQLIASGKRVDGGEGKGERWERRLLEVPGLGFSFEIGRYDVQSMDVGEVRLNVAVDRETLSLAPEGARSELMFTVADALRFYQKEFGPYPLDELTVVTVPRQYSQALLGLVTLSSQVLLDWGVFGPLLRVQDRGSVVAHEIAHQWWGHLVGWRSYRDQWISEAMANYAALLWARHRGLAPSVGPVTGWQQELTATVADGRPIESLGPLVLGERLFSSRSQDAYHGIVYRKGALVLEMLARKLGDDDFRRALATVVASASGRTISTADFLSLLERITATDLDAFARQFIYGTGLPEIDYDYAFEPRDGGGWRVRVDARQQMPVRTRYAIVTLPGGRLDVARGRVEQGVDVEGSELVVPLQILLTDGPTASSAAQPDAREPGAPEFSGNGRRQDLLVGKIVISGRHTELEFDLDWRPSKLWLDRDREIFGLFLDRRAHPKRMLLKLAAKQAATGELTPAEDTLRRALAARSPLSSTDHLLDAHLHLRLAGVLLDLGRDREAAGSLDLAKQVFEREKASLPGSEIRRFASAFEIAEARIEVRRGDYLGALERLSDGVLDPRDATSTEGYLLLAIAAQATGRQGELEEALEIARRRGADVSRLPPQSPRPQHGSSAHLR